MRTDAHAFVATCAAALPLSGPVLRVGGPWDRSEGESDPTSAFSDHELVDEGSPPDGPDPEDLAFPDDAFGVVLLTDVLDLADDPRRAVDEARRVCRPDGVVIATSHPDAALRPGGGDAWRFTPTGLRRLTREFAAVAVFSSGPPDRPTTVAFVASPAAVEGTGLRSLTAALEELDVPAPPVFDSETRRLVHLLSQRLTAGDGSEADATDDVELDWPHDRRGWTLVDGAQISGSVGHDPGGPVVVRAGGTVLARLRAHPHDGRWRFAGQVRTDGDDHVGPVTVSLGEEGPVALRSAPGVVVGRLERHAGFRLHTLDERPVATAGDDEHARGARLVADLQAAGDPVAVDLGCGFRKHGTVGIDVTRDGTDADLVCRAGFEPIPLPSGSVDSVFCRDFLEHVPKAVWRDGTLQYPVIDLMNEIWRIMRPGAEFLSLTPGYPEPEVHQDPTHVSVWVENSFGYFTGRYPVARAYGVRCDFEQVELGWDGFYLRAVLRKPGGDPA